jgi:hypothetical protein
VPTTKPINRAREKSWMLDPPKRKRLATVNNRVSTVITERART